MKKVLSLLLTGAFVFSLSGCFNKNKENLTIEEAKNKVISEATQYLKENYPDDEFTYKSYRGPSWAYTYYEVFFTSKEYDNQKVTVFVDPQEGSTEYQYCDNYFQYYMKDDAEEFFYNVATSYLSDEIIVSVSFSNGIGFAKAIKSNDFYENLKDNNLSVSVNIFSINSYDDSQEKVYSFLNYFLENNLDISITYYCVKNLTEINDQYIDSIDKNKNYIERKGFYLYDNKISEYD